MARPKNDYRLDMRFILWQKGLTDREIADQTLYNLSDVIRFRNVNKLAVNRAKNTKGLDLIGKRFGALIVKAKVGSGKKGSLYQAKCLCGCEIVVNRKELMEGKRTSCGCGIHRLRLMRMGG